MQKLSIEYRIKLRRVLLIMLAWALVAILMTVYERSAALSRIMQQGSTGFDFPTTLAFNLGAALMGGLMGGSFLVFFVNVKYRDRPYGWTVLAVAASFVVVISLIILTMGGAAALWAARGDPERAGLVFRAIVGDSLHLKNIVFWAPVVMLTQFTLQISDKFGPGVLWHFLSGRYNVPRSEERIFMFADLKGSTAIAERLGNQRYHLFLRDYFADLTDPIQYSQGEIYQYVGDEVIVSWQTANGLADSQCLRCFFAMQQALAARADRYIARYGLAPTFKAGMHIGAVIAGEIGIIKRDITYSGDILNTTARIQGMCNEQGVDLLCSQDLLRLLPADRQFIQISRGAIELRGKGAPVKVGTVRMAAAA